MSRRPGRERLGLLVRLFAAVPIGGSLVLSFSGLAGLARLSRIDGWLAYLWPLSLDATGVVATAVWLDARMPHEVRRAARWLALTAIVLSVAGNSLYHWLIDGGHRPHVAVQMGVGSVPPLTLFALLHVLQLAARAVRPPAKTRAAEPASPRPPAGNPWAGRVIVVTSPAGDPHTVLATPASPPAPRLDLSDRLRVVIPASQPARAIPASQRQPAPGDWQRHLDAARQVIAEHPSIGRPALAARLSELAGHDVPTSQARQILAHLRNQTSQLAIDHEESHA
ncbi:DUF2637 domain-containing protein [Umezawaea beigongshangensis]|uniref:DUF2637 domain-containing protein n=1 Tax=Umezawaea beigongshangensis TaxID=2780383 RepID=UPI0018F1E2F5|nr:DUF2637 domain-containing protein [Umezawaea beigongshangensis]